MQRLVRAVFGKDDSTSSGAGTRSFPNRRCGAGTTGTDPVQRPVSAQQTIPGVPQARSRADPPRGRRPIEGANHRCDGVQARARLRHRGGTGGPKYGHGSPKTPRGVLLVAGPTNRNSASLSPSVHTLPSSRTLSQAAPSFRTRSSLPLPGLWPVGAPWSPRQRCLQRLRLWVR